MLQYGDDDYDNMGDDDYDDYSKDYYKKSKDRGRGELGPPCVFLFFIYLSVLKKRLIHVPPLEQAQAYSICLTVSPKNSLTFTLSSISAPGGKGGRGRGRGKGGRGMMRGGRGRNRGRGRGDMGNDDDNNGDMDNGVRLL